MTTADADRLPQGNEKAQQVTAMFDTIAPNYDRINRLMTFGLDTRWRRRTVDALALPAGAVVVDLACGTGDLCAELGRADLVALGVDLSQGMLAAAHTTVPLARADVVRLPLGEASVDGATSGFALRNLVDLAAFFAELARVVRPGGRIALLEIAEPQNRAMRIGHHFYLTRVVPQLGALLSDPAAYRYLPRSVAYLPPPESLVASVAGAGFSDARQQTLTGGTVQLIVGTRG